MSKSLLRNNTQSPITLPPPYTGIIAPGDSVVLDDPPHVVTEVIGIVPELINYLTVSQVPDAQPVDGHDRASAAAGIVGALANLTEPLDINGQRIVNLAEPIDQQDAATKQYVDLHAGGGSGTVQQVNTGAGLTGGPITVTGTLAVDFGSTAGKVTQGNDARLNPAPGLYGSIVYDAGAGYEKTAAGSPGQVFKVGAGGLPEWGTDSTTPSGPAGGSLAGTYPSPTIAAGAISNTEVNAAAAIATSKLSGALTDITGNGLEAFVNAATKVARTYYVAVNGSAINDGSIYKPFATVQQAHDAAATEFPGGEFVAIEIGPGTFAGDINITRKNTLIQGKGHRAEMFATVLSGSITVNPTFATSKFGDMVGIAGCFVSVPSSSTAPAVKMTGSGLFSLILNDCYIYTNNSDSTASAFACDATNAQRPRIILNDCIVATEKGGPAIMQLDRGDARCNNTAIRHNSGVTLGSAGPGVNVLNDATLWLNSCAVETRSAGAAIVATGATSATKLLLTTASVAPAYAGAEDTTHGITVGNTAGLAAYLWQAAFTVTDVSPAVYAINGTGVVYYGDLTFTTGTNSAIAPTLTMMPLVEKHGTVNLPSLTASLPLKLDATKTVTAAAISLAGGEVAGTLPVGKGGTGISTTPVAGAVVYGNGTTQAYTPVGTTGQALLSDGSNAPAFGPLDLAGTNTVTGLLPNANQAAQTVGGDLSGTTAAATVTHLQGNVVDATTLGAGDSGKALVWTGSTWQADTITPGGGGSGGGGLTYYLNYGVAGASPTPNGADKQLSLIFSDGAASTPATEAPNGGAHAVLAQFVTPIGQPGETTIPPGIWDIVAYLLASHADGVFFRAVIYKWDGLTLSSPIATSNDVQITTIGPTPEAYTAAVVVPQTVLASNERIVITIEVSRTTAPLRTVTGYFGNGTPSHAHTAIGAPGGTGIVKVVDGIIQAPATLLVNADVDLDADIAVSKLSGTSDGGAANKVLHGSNSVGGEAVWGAVALGSDVSGQLPVPNGGTGLSSGTAGGIPYFDTATSMKSTATLTENALIVGSTVNGLSPLATLGTTSYVLHGNELGAPSWGLVNLSSEVSGTLPIANGGTNGTATPTAGGVAYGNGTAYAFTPTGTAGYLLKSNGISPPEWLDKVPVTNGGTGLDATVTDQVPYGNATADALVYTTGGATGQVLGRLTGGGLGWITNEATPSGPTGPGGDLTGNYPAPTVAKIKGTAITTAGGSLAAGAVLRATSSTDADWGTVDLGSSAAVSGTLAGVRGGTGHALYAKGDMLYSADAGTALSLLTVGADGKVLTVKNGIPSWEATGTVTSVGMDTTATGLTVNTTTSATITSSGTFTLGGKLNIASGGTNNDAIGVLGGVAYSDGTKLTYTAAGTLGQALAVGAGGLEWVNGLPPVGIATGDLSASYPNPTVAKINGATVNTAGGALVTGNVLHVTGVSTVDYGTVNLASATDVSGTLGVGNGGTGQSTLALNSVIIGNGSSAVTTLGPASGKLMGWDATTGVASTISLSPRLSMTGSTLDVAGVGTLNSVTLTTGTTGLLVNAATSAEVTGASGTFTLSGTLATSNGGTNNTATPTAGTVVYGDGTKLTYTTVGTAGQALLSNGADAPAFGALNLAGGGNVVTGTLPKGNQEAQDLAGDLSGTTSNATVTKIQNNPVQSGALGLSDAGKALVWTGAAWNASTVSGTGGAGGGGGFTYFLNYTNAGAAPLPAAGAKELSLNFDDVTPSTDTGAITVLQSSYLKLSQFVTPVGEPGATTVPPGIWEVGVYAKADVSDSAFVRAVLSKWDGSSLTTLATSSDVQVTATGLPELTTVDFFVASTVLAANERLVLTLEGIRTVAGTRTITLYFEGDTVSHVHTTLGAPGGTGVVKVVDGVVQAPASLIVNADINNDAAIAVTKLDGTTGGGTANTVLHGGATPSWSAVALGSDVTGTLHTNHGGTGQASYTVGDMLYYSTGTSLSKLTVSPTAGAVLTSNGSAPAYQTSLLVTANTVTMQKPLLMAVTPQSLTLNTDTILPTTSYIQLTASGALTMQSTPTISTTGAVAGQTLTLINVGTNTIILQDDDEFSGTKIHLGGVDSRALSQYTSIDLIFDGTYWIERSIGGSGTVQSVTATNNLIQIGGLLENPTVGIRGLTGANPGTSGGIPFFSSTSQFGSSELLAANSLMIGGGAGAAPSTPIAVGTAGQALLSNGAGANPAFGALNISTAAVTGTLPINKGGTGTASAPTTNGIIYAASGTAYASTSAGTNGTVLKGSTGNAPVFSALVESDIPSLAATKITGLPYDIAGSAAVPSANESCFFFVAVRPCTIEAGTHRAGCRVAPSGGDVQFTVKKNYSDSLGTFTISDGATSASFSLSAGAASLSVGDVITVTTGATTFGILDVYFTLKAIVA